MIQWKQEIKGLRNVVSCHELVIKQVLLIDLPCDILDLILFQLQVKLRREFTGAIRKLIEGLEKGAVRYLSVEDAFARRNAIYKLIHLCCIFPCASFWHLRSLPCLRDSFTSKLNELILIFQHEAPKRFSKKSLEKLGRKWSGLCKEHAQSVFGLSTNCICKKPKSKRNNGTNP